MIDVDHFKSVNDTLGIAAETLSFDFWLTISERFFGPMILSDALGRRVLESYSRPAELLRPKS
jgi:hypothetical protein